MIGPEQKKRKYVIRPARRAPYDAPRAEAADLEALARLIDSRGRHELVAEAAYFKALERGVAGGDPVGDWLAAEREIDELLVGYHVRSLSTERAKRGGRS